MSVLVCTRNVAHVTNRLKVVLEVDDVLAGGGKALRKLPAGAARLQRGNIRRWLSLMERGHDRDQRCRAIPAEGPPITVGEASAGRGAAVGVR